VRVETHEVMLYLGTEPFAPPIQEVIGVIGKGPFEISADLRRVCWINWRSAHVVRIIFRRDGTNIRLHRDRCSVNVSIDDLNQPVRSKGGTESAKHVVTTQPPASDVSIHR